VSGPPEKRRTLRGTPDNRPPKRIGGSNKLHSMTETAELLGVSYVTLKHNFRVWGIPYIPVGRRIMFRDRDVQAWLERIERS
jgi:excisionase family DNA binding protein